MKRRAGIVSSRSMTSLPSSRGRHVQLLLLFIGFLVVGLSNAFSSPPSSTWRLAPQGALRQSIIRHVVAKSGGKMIVTEEMYNEIVLAEDIARPVLVFFSAPWCGPCRLTNPVVKEVMKQFAGAIDVVEMCTDDLADIAEEAGVVSIPTIQFYYGGQCLETIVGCVAKSVLANAVGKVLEDTQQLQQKKP